MMSEDVISGRKKKSSVSKYASNVLKESSVSAISGILTTGSISRKVFKSVIFLLFTITFLYQVITFLTYVFEFPTVVNIDIYRPENVMMPAFTMCNSQRIRRSKYCSRYPDRCTSTNDEFCEINHSYCKYSDIMVKEEYLQNFETDINFLRDVFDLGTSSEEMFSIRGLFSGSIAYIDDNIVRSRSTEVTDFSLCVAVNSFIYRPEEPSFITHEYFKSKIFVPNQQFEINTHDNDVFDPHILPGVYFSIHSPYENVNPYDSGYFLLPGRRYKITIRIKEEKLLPSPYKTDCNDYTQSWMSNNKSGPRTQEMCQQKCVAEVISDCFNCSAPFVLYQTKNTNICPTDLHTTQSVCNKTDEIKNRLQGCFESCKAECLKIIYITEIREARMPRMTDDDSFNNSRVAIVDLSIDNEILRYEFTPKYQNVEAFSYIGGFIGIWLGVSLVQVTEFLESLFLICRYFFKKKSCKSPIDK